MKKCKKFISLLITVLMMVGMITIGIGSATALIGKEKGKETQL